MTMSKQLKKYQSGLIMAIYPNSVGFGLAVMKNAVDLELAQVVSVKPRPVSNEKVMEKIREKIAYYEPDTIVVKEFDPTSKHKRTLKLQKKIVDFLKGRSIKYSLYSRADIRFAFSNFNAHTKHEIATTIAKHIPQMKKVLMNKRRCYEGEAYITGAFDAVSLGITHFYMID
jgi:hypothetical protein